MKKARGLERYVKIMELHWCNIIYDTHRSRDLPHYDKLYELSYTCFVWTPLLGTYHNNYDARTDENNIYEENNSILIKFCSIHLKS